VSTVPDPTPKPPLRLFSPDQLAAADADQISGLSAAMTLPEFGRAYVLKTWLPSRRSSPLTIDGYRHAYDLWAELTDDPPLAQLSDIHAAQFIAGLFDRKGRRAETLSPATVHKICRPIRTTLGLAGPRTKTHKRARRLIEEPPEIEMPTVEIDDVLNNFEVSELAAIVQACQSMTMPKEHDWIMPPRGRRKTAKPIKGTGIPPPRYWLSLVCVTYNTGERKGAIFKVMQPPPAADSIHFPPATRKGKKRGTTVHLNQYAREAINAIRSDRELLFPWPHSPRHFYTVWWKLLKRAGIPESRWFGLHGLRKATCTEISAYSPMGAQLVMGHSDGTLLEKHYVNKRIKRDALERLPQPSWHQSDAQLRLF
jgi:hypothetical protein